MLHFIAIITTLSLSVALNIELKTDEKCDIEHVIVSCGPAGLETNLFRIVWELTVIRIRHSSLSDKTEVNEENSSDPS